jgi:hypothetical protein
LLADLARCPPNRARIRVVDLRMFAALPHTAPSR